MQATFSSAFLRRAPEAARFLPADFRDPGARARHVRLAAERPLHPQLLGELREQNLALYPSAARRANLEALASPRGGSAIVVTGQQVGLFLGPLFTFYKAASAIAAARALEQESGVRCVPLFWLQTEDHDFAEINHCDILRPGAAPLRLQLDEAESRISVAHRCLGADITSQLALLEEALGELPHAGEFLGRLAAHYRQGATWAAAFAGLLGELFADEGLLFLDPRRPAVAALAAPLYRRSLEQQAALTAALQSRSEALCAAGLDEQVRVRPNTSLLFFHPDGPSGGRYRLERLPRDAGWSIPSLTSPEQPCGRRFTDAEILTLVDSQPLCFSTSALLRPLVQDSLLPTAAYVAGPGELNYFAQLPPLYELLGVPPALAMPRARFRCTDDRCRGLLRELQLSASDLESPRTELLHRLAAAAPSPLPAPELVRDRLRKELTMRLDELVTLDGALEAPVRRTRQSIAINIDRFVDKYSRLVVDRDRVTSDRVDRLQRFLFPGGEPQERVYSLPYFACRYGIGAFKQKLFESLLLTSPFFLAPGPAVRNLEL